MTLLFVFIFLCLLVSIFLLFNILASVKDVLYSSRNKEMSQEDEIGRERVMLTLFAKSGISHSLVYSGVYSDNNYDKAFDILLLNFSRVPLHERYHTYLLLNACFAGCPGWERVKDDILSFCPPIDVNVESQKHRHERMPPLLEKEQGVRLFRFLVRDQFIPSTSHEASFLYLMGCADDMPECVQHISWLKNKQLLREMLEEAFRELLDKGQLQKVDLERLTPLCFEKEGEPMKLAKNKPVASTDSDAIKNFFRPSPTLIC